jgi:hypothetical protein
LPDLPAIVEEIDSSNANFTPWCREKRQMNPFKAFAAQSGIITRFLLQSVECCTDNGLYIFEKNEFACRKKKNSE